MQAPQITDDDRIVIIRRCISSVQGWKNLADSIKTSTNPDAYDQCINLFKKMAGDKEIAVPATDVETREQDEVKMMFFDMLVMQLNKHFDE